MKKRKFRFPLWAKTLIVLIFSVSLVSSVAVIFSTNQSKNLIRTHYINKSVELADTLSIYLNFDDVKEVKDAVVNIYETIPHEKKVDNTHWDEDEWTTYLDNFTLITEMPAYNRLMDQLKTFNSKNDIRFIYLAYADFELNHLVYLVDYAEVDEERCPPGSFDEFTEQDLTVKDHIDSGFEPEITNFEEYGYLVSSGRAIFDENHKPVAFAMIDLSMDDIVAKENETTRTLIIILVSLGVGAIALGFALVILMIIRPVRILTKAANEYIEGDNGNLDKFAKINVKTSDEIEDLSNSMKKMEEDINKYIDDLLSTTTKLEGAEQKADRFKILADRDALTGLNNKRSYFENEERLNEEIKAGKAKFAISMIDLNDLKVTNDTLGHEKGDLLIIALSKIVKTVFANSSIYRIGGDEFVAISEGEDYDNIKDLEKVFTSTIRRTMKKLNEDDLLVSAAIGVAKYDPDFDLNVEDVFKRADAKMYDNKKAMKANR